MLVETLIPEAAVETFGETVLHGSAGYDAVPLDTAMLLPGEDCVRGELGAIVADHQAGVATRSDRSAIRMCPPQVRVSGRTIPEHLGADAGVSDYKETR